MNRTLIRLTIVLLIAEALLILGPQIILGAAINWPASLDEPASVNLPLILEQAESVQSGYLIYGLYSVLILPLGLMLAKVVAQDKPLNLVLQIASAFAVGSAVFRVLGIIRWLLPMPVIADLYVNPAASEDTRHALSAMYEMLNSYAGGVGEILGVGLFASAWILLTSVAILQYRSLPRLLGYGGIAAAVLLMANTLEIFRLDVGILLTLSVAALHLWWLAAAVVLMRGLSTSQTHEEQLAAVQLR